MADLPHAVEPVEWFVVFHRKSTFRWLSWLACGEFKHVSAFAYYPGFKVWLLYDVHIGGTALIMLSHDRAKETLASYVDGCTVVKIARNARPFGLSLLSRLLFHCTPAIGNLVGMPFIALTPNHLFRHLMRNGAEIVVGGAGALPRPAKRRIELAHEQDAGYSGRPKSGDRATAGAERSRLVAAE